MSTLPHLQTIFEKLKSGYHLCHEDAELHAALKKNPDEYVAYFAAIGITLVPHPKDFFYFQSEERDNESRQLPRVAIFTYVLIDHTANQGLPIEDFLMTNTFSLRGLPHFSLDSYRAHLRQVGLIDPDGLRDVVQYLTRIGWAKWLGGDEFKFLRPFHRAFETCLELSKLSVERAKEIVTELNGDASTDSEIESSETHA